MSIDADGLVSLTPHPQSCGAGCGYAMGGATFEFSFDAGSLAPTGLTLVDSAPGLAITATWMDADSFRITVGDGGGVTNAITFQAQLEFAEAPEPAMLSVFAIAAMALGAARRRRRA